MNGCEWCAPDGSARCNMHKGVPLNVDALLYELRDEQFGRSVVADSDCNFDPTTLPYEPGDNVKPKFGSVAAAIMWGWSLDSSQDRDCGEAELGNGWHALFESERAVLHTDAAGFVSAWRIEDGADIDAVWAGIESGARYTDDNNNNNEG